MAIIASDNGGGTDYKPVGQGTHLAICVMVADMGRQQTSFGGDTSVKHQVYIRWEIPEERMEDRDEPMSIGRTYTLSLHQKAGLRKDLEAWRGKAFTQDELKGFDIFKLLCVPAMLTVTHEPKADGSGISAKVRGVSALPKGMPRPPRPFNEPVLYDADSTSDWDKLPNWLQERINSQEKAPVIASTSAKIGLDDEIPF